MAAYATEVARQPDLVQAEFALGLDRFVDTIAGQLPAEPAVKRGGTGAEHGRGRRRGAAITLLAAMVGGMALARATARSAPDLSTEILASLRVRLPPLAHAADGE